MILKDKRTEIVLFVSCFQKDLITSSLRHDSRLGPHSRFCFSIENGNNNDGHVRNGQWRTLHIAIYHFVPVPCTVYASANVQMCTRYRYWTTAMRQRLLKIHNRTKALRGCKTEKQNFPFVVALYVLVESHVGTSIVVLKEKKI